jgi:hypothetical protein
MNTANLQLEGLVMAMAEINRLLARKGVASREDLGLALRRAEASLAGEDKSQELSPANRDAIAFPVRLLLLANDWDPNEDLPDFGALAKMVGSSKQPYNDQR